MNWKLVLQSVITAFVSGAVAGVTTQAIAPNTSNKVLITNALAGGVIGVVNHLRQAPVTTTSSTPASN